MDEEGSPLAQERIAADRVASRLELAAAFADQWLVAAIHPSHDACGARGMRPTASRHREMGTL